MKNILLFIVLIYIGNYCLAQCNAIISSQNITCFGDSNGIATVTPCCGIAPYSYLWNTTQMDTSQSITNLAQGSYSVTITDSIGCINISTVTITQPQKLQSYMFSNFDFCHENSYFSLYAFGGIQPYSYLWSSGDTINNPQYLISGNYCVTVTDHNNCSTSICDSIISHSIFAYALISPLCSGNGLGSIDLTINDENYQYNYQWSNGATTEDLIDVSTGIYTVTATDNSGYGCIHSTTITLL